MEPINQAMLMLHSIDESAKLAMVRHVTTGEIRWYVASRIEIADDHFLRGVAPHAHTPYEAVSAMLGELQTVTRAGARRIVLNARHDRREYYWNGVAFAELS